MYLVDLVKLEETKLNFNPKARFKKVKIVILII